MLTNMPCKRQADRWLARLKNRMGSKDYKAADPVMKQTMTKLLREDLTPLLDKIGTETLLIWGDRDTASPLTCARILERHIQGAGLCILKGAGHWALTERPMEVNAILKSFLM